MDVRRRRRRLLLLFQSRSHNSRKFLLFPPPPPRISSPRLNGTINHAYFRTRACACITFYLFHYNYYFRPEMMPWRLIFSDEKSFSFFRLISLRGCQNLNLMTGLVPVRFCDVSVRLNAVSEQKNSRFFYPF